jgi:hypothetical protein
VPDKEPPSDDRFAGNDMRRRFEQKFQTPGDDPFEQWYWTMQRYYSRRVDPEIMELYRKMLSAIPMDELQAVWEAYLIEPDTPRGPPGVNVLYAKWKARKDKQDSSRQAKRTRSVVTKPALNARLRSKMHVLIHSAITMTNLGAEGFNLDAPEWMEGIANWTAQQWKNDHPDGEITEEIAQNYYTLGLDLFDTEVTKHGEDERGKDTQTGR